MLRVPVGRPWLRPGALSSLCCTREQHMLKYLCIGRTHQLPDNWSPAPDHLGLFSCTGNPGIYLLKGTHQWPVWTLPMALTTTQGLKETKTALQMVHRITSKTHSQQDHMCKYDNIVCWKDSVLQTTPNRAQHRPGTDRKSSQHLLVTLRKSCQLSPISIPSSGHLKVNPRFCSGRALEKPFNWSQKDTKEESQSINKHVTSKRCLSVETPEKSTGHWKPRPSQNAKRGFSCLT